MRLLITLFSFWMLLYSCGIQKFDLPEALNEVSGIEQISRGLYVTVNDSGDDPALYYLNSAGEILHKVFIDGAKNIDWEDITYADSTGFLYVGDIGNNLNQRKDLAIYKIEVKPVTYVYVDGQPTSSLFQDTIEAIKYSYSYPDQEKFPPEKGQLNFDSEALTFVDGKIIILSKSRTKPFNGICKIYECEFSNEKISINLSQTIKLKGFSWLTGSVTGCDYSNQMLYVLTYKRIHAFEKTEQGYRFIKKMKLGRLQQWEGICVDSEKQIRIVAERSRLGKQKMKTIKLWN